MATPSPFADLNPQRRDFPRIYVYDRLWTTNYVDGSLDLELAQTVENPDPLTYIFKIKPNANHQNLPPVNGRAVDSQDVKVSWDTFVADKTTTNKSIFTDFVDHFELPDTSTFTVKMKTPDSWALSVHGLSAPYVSTILPREMCDGTLRQTSAVGPGAYVLDKFDANSVFSVKRRPDSWWATDGRPYIDAVTVTVMSDPNVQAAALKSKQVDWLQARDKLQANEFQGYSQDISIHRELSQGQPTLVMMADPNSGYFKDQRLRQAVYTGLDIQGLIDSVELGEGVYSGPVPPYLSKWVLPDDELKKDFPNDVATAKQLVSASGWDTNTAVDLKFLSTDIRTPLVATQLQTQLGAIGIKLNLVPQAAGTFYQDFLTGNFQLLLITGGGYDPDLFLRNMTTAGQSGSNWAHWSDAEYDAIVKQQEQEFDATKQTDLILQAQRMWFTKAAPAILLYEPYDYYAYWGYYHRQWRGDDGYVGENGHYDWLDVNHPAYPTNRT